MTLIKNLVILFLLVFTGCKIHEPYQRPEFKEPEKFYGSGNIMESDTVNMANLNWKEFFDDPVLISLIDSALVNSIDVQIANEYVEMGLSRLKQSKANFFPSVSAAPFKARRDYFSENYNNYGSNRSRRIYGEEKPPTSFYTERLEYESSVDLSWELDLWGKLRAQKKASLHAYMKSMEFQKAVRTSLIAEIAITYSNLLLLQSQLEVFRRNLQLNDSTMQMVKLQYDAGEVTSLAVKQTQSQSLRAQTLIPQLEREYILQENRLNRLIGRFPEPIETEELEWDMLDDDYVVGMPLALLRNRPDVAAAEYNLQESYEKVGVANAMRYPSINIGASVGLNSFQFDKLLNPAGSGFLLLNGLVFQPIFQKRRLKTNYEVALSQKKVAELEFRDKFLLAMGEVSNAMVAIEKLKEEYEIAQNRVETASKAVKDAFLLFQSGMASYLEVITAQSEALDSELNLESVKMQLFAANVELYRSLGGGWK
ncbi:efflux transporter outer membrane subunit [Flexithrix dorotheae]|uniref:efflux transporter outer membrane subunit n=1 Tax=Flexithrix dorotheae TaxID=70993 RepID=UPI0012FCB3D3|nr:efflux transporter outer membrane subunit [Flexithrix dorotheae]